MRDWIEWIKFAGIRAVKTMAQAALGYVSGAYVLADVDWGVCLSASLVAGVISVLMSLAGLPEENKETYTIADRIGEDENDDI